MGDEAESTEPTEPTGDGVERVRAEHLRLDEMFVEVTSVLGQSTDLEEVRDSFAALAEQVDVHFEQEDRLYYATIAALRPELKSDVEAIALSHRFFRAAFAEIGDLLARDDLEGARQAFTRLTREFEQHEASEERLLKRVEREVARVL